MEISVNYLAVLVAALVGMVIGALWYSPAGFGKPWMAMMGLSDASMDEAKKKGMGKLYALAFLGQLVTAFVMAHFAYLFKANTVALGLQLGFWTWLGFNAPSFLGQVLWESKPWKLYILNTAHYLVVYMAMAMVLAAWG